MFEENTFVPTAKIKGDKKFSIVSDQLGTPIQGYDDTGELIWERELDSFGKTKMLVGDNGFCNYLYQGQSVDQETGLAYNRFRYFDPNDGRYISVDPIGLFSGEFNFYAYVDNPNRWLDIFGLAKSYGPKKKKGIALGQSKRRRLRSIVEDLRRRKKTNEQFVEFQNRDGVLPRNKKYTEHDYETPPTAAQRANGADRGTKRIVIDEDGTAYYTNDHYDNFVRLDI